MSYRVSFQRTDELLKGLKGNTAVYAPIRFAKRGRYADTDLIRYGRIDSIRDVVYREKSHFSPKEIIHPITQAMFHYTEFEYLESRVDEREILLFVRPCDIHGIHRLDTMFLHNGGNRDSYYERLRRKVKFVLMECGEGWDTCFCASMGTNRSEGYSLAVRFDGDHLLVEVKDPLFEGLFHGEERIDFRPRFVERNEITVTLPVIDSPALLAKVRELEMWKSFDSRCQSCGACTAACISCSCFTTQDITYSENGSTGERRRVWASCLHPKFTEMAGGHSFRPTAGDRMRFRTLHKIHDFNERFGEGPMCVGCGRCADRCPQLISFAATVNRLSSEVERLKREAPLAAEART